MEDIRVRLSVLWLFATLNYSGYAKIILDCAGSACSVRCSGCTRGFFHRRDPPFHCDERKSGPYWVLRLRQHNQHVYEFQGGLGRSSVRLWK